MATSVLPICVPAQAISLPNILCRPLRCLLRSQRQEMPDTKRCAGRFQRTSARPEGHRRSSRKRGGGRTRRAARGAPAKPSSHRKESGPGPRCGRADLTARSRPPAGWARSTRAPRGADPLPCRAWLSSRRPIIAQARTPPGVRFGSTCHAGGGIRGGLTDAE